MYALQQKVMCGIASIFAGIKTRIDNAIVRYDGWFLVFAAVLLALAFTIIAGMAIWCVVYKGKKFTGDWKWSIWGVKLKVECV